MTVAWVLNSLHQNAFGLGRKRIFVPATCLAASNFVLFLLNEVQNASFIVFRGQS